MFRCNDCKYNYSIDLTEAKWINVCIELSCQIETWDHDLYDCEYYKNKFDELEK